MTTTDGDPGLHAYRPLERFDDRASDYVRWRPTYPPAAIDAVLGGLADASSLRAADVGAGTGISARLLADRGVRVVAVEPNARMRAAAAPHPRVEWRDGRAEATGLADGAVDLVLCAQAFHWFRSAAALDEFARVLAPSGRVALVWNERAEDDAATAEFGRIVREAAAGDPAAHGHVRPDALFASRRFVGARTRTFRHAQRLDAEGLVGRARSASYLPLAGPAHDRMVAALRALPARLRTPDGVVSLVYATAVHLAERATDAAG